MKIVIELDVLHVQKTNKHVFYVLMKKQKILMENVFAHQVNILMEKEFVQLVKLLDVLNVFQELQHYARNVFI